MTRSQAGPGTVRQQSHRRLMSPALWAFSALVAACSSTEPKQYVLRDFRDTLQTRGTLLTNVECPINAQCWIDGNLVWIPGTELVAFASGVSSGGFKLETVDATSHSTAVLDSGDASAYYASFDEPYFSGLVVTPDGTALFYEVAPSSQSGAWQLRVANPTGGIPSSLRSGVLSPLAMSVDGRYLAYVEQSSTSESLVVRDVASGAERRYADSGAGNEITGPILFSPDGAELLYQQGYSVSRTYRRLSLVTGASAALVLPDLFPQLLHWGASGIEALVWGNSEYRVHRLAAGTSVRVGALASASTGVYEGFQWGHEAWSADGTRVAYWVGRCHHFAGWGNCAIARYALFVADAHTGEHVQVALTSGEPGPTAFSPDGRRIVYSSGAASFDARPVALYLVQVP